MLILGGCDRGEGLVGELSITDRHTLQHARPLAYAGHLAYSEGRHVGKKQSKQDLADGTLEGLRSGDPDAGIDQRLVSAQNFVVVQRRAYQASLEHRGEVVHLAHAAGWTKYRIAKRLGITRRAVDEALERPVPRTPEAHLDLEVKRNGGLENPDIRNIRALLRRADGQAAQ